MAHLPAAESVLSIRDGTDSLSFMSLWVLGATELAPARAAVAELAELVELVTGCVVERFTLHYKTHLTDSKPPPGAPAADRLVLVLACAGEHQYAVVSVPGRKAAIMLPDGTVDTAHPAVAALVARLVAAPWCNPFGYDIEALESAHYEFKP